jgi:hypothetical protein
VSAINRGLKSDERQAQAYPPTATRLR